MAKKVYLVLITILTIVCIIAGSYRNLRMHRSYDYNEEPAGYTSGPPSEEDEQWLNAQSVRINGSEEKSDGQKISTVRIEADACSFTIETGPGFEVLTESDGVTVDVEGGELVIRQKTKNGVISPGSESNIYLIVSGDNRLSALDANLSAGNIDINSLSVDDLKVQCSMGSVNLYDVSAKHADLHTAMGNSYTHCRDFETLSLTVDMGEVTVLLDEEATAAPSIDAETGLGEIIVNGEAVGSNYSGFSDSERSVKIKAGMGSIEIQGTV